MSINLEPAETQKIYAAWESFTNNDPDEDNLRSLIESLEKVEQEMRARVRAFFDDEEMRVADWTETERTMKTGTVRDVANEMRDKSA